MLADPIRQLRDELYALMLADGASPSAISRMPGLMALSYIRDEAPGEAPASSLAAVVRGCIEQATYALEEPVPERDDKDIDQGAAARCLLALYPGTGSAALSQRRKRAADFLGRKVRTITKRQLRAGEVSSHETRLMGDVATQLWERETEFRQSLVPSTARGDRSDYDQALALLHGVWRAASDLNGNLGAEMRRQRPREEWDLWMLRSLVNLAEFFNLLEEPSDEELAHADWDAEVFKRSGHAEIIASMYTLTPFNIEVLRELMREPDLASRQTDDALITAWRDWNDDGGGRVKEEYSRLMLFQRQLHRYTESAEYAWELIANPDQSIHAYGASLNPKEHLERLRIRH